MAWQQPCFAPSLRRQHQHRGRQTASYTQAASAAEPVVQEPTKGQQQKQQKKGQQRQKQGGKGSSPITARSEDFNRCRTATLRAVVAHLAISGNLVIDLPLGCSYLRVLCSSSPRTPSACMVLLQLPCGADVLCHPHRQALSCQPVAPRSPQYSPQAAWLCISVCAQAGSPPGDTGGRPNSVVVRLTAGALHSVGCSLASFVPITSAFQRAGSWPSWLCSSAGACVWPAQGMGAPALPQVSVAVALLLSGFLHIPAGGIWT